MVELQGWAYDIAGGLADHTYVFSPSNGRYFDCWGGHDGPGKRLVCKGEGNYDVADCYRGPVWVLDQLFRDTAKIGVYAIDGVCHQSANCFLYSTKPRVTLNNSVRPYDITSVLYGPWGRNYPSWLKDVYGTCARRFGVAEDPDVGAEGELLRRLGEIHLGGDREGRELNLVLADQFEEAARHAAPGADREQLRDIQLAYLEQMDEVVASGARGEELADRINALARGLQGELATRLDPGHYEALLGASPDAEPVDVVEPGLRHIAGHPVTPADESDESTE